MINTGGGGGSGVQGGEATCSLPHAHTHPFKGSVMIVGVRKKHWVLLSLTLTGVLVLLVFSVQPLRTSTHLPGVGEIGFLRRKIANDDSDGSTGRHSLDSQHTSSQHPPRAPVHLTQEEREQLAKQGVLLIEEEQQEDGVAAPAASHPQESHQPTSQEQQLLRQSQQQRQPHHKHGHQLLQQSGSQHDQWLQQIELQHKKFLREQRKLQEHHLLEAQMLQQKLQQDDSQTKNGALPGDPQSYSMSVVSKTAQVSQGWGGAASGHRKYAIPSMPHMSYDNLKKHGITNLRYIIKREFMMAQRDTTFTPGEKVESSQVRRVIIVSTWRSGSSYLGDLLRAYPGTFFSFEPLHHLLKNLHLQEGPLVEDVLKLLRGILTCDFSQLDVYVNYMRNNTFLIDHNTRLWNSCAMNRALCFDRDYLSETCRYFPVNVLKTVRMGLSPAIELLQDPSLDLRVVHLVRDPRGCLHSRMKLSWCHSRACSDPETVCKDLLTDLKLSDTLRQNFPDRYLMVRYEDMGLQPQKKAREIFQFLQLSYNKYVATFVREHTTPSRKTRRKGNAYSTFRDSRAITFAWRGALNFTTVEAIQDVCVEPLQHLQLRIFQNEEEYLNTTIPVLLNSA